MELTCCREVARNDPYGMAADNWSLGVMLYALLFGESPFYCAETKDTLRRVRSCGYQFPCHEKNLGDAKDLIQSLIVEDPKARLSLDGALLVGRSICGTSRKPDTDANSLNFQVSWHIVF